MFPPSLSSPERLILNRAKKRTMNDDNGNDAIAAVHDVTLYVLSLIRLAAFSMKESVTTQYNLRYLEFCCLLSYQNWKENLTTLNKAFFAIGLGLTKAVKNHTQNVVGKIATDSFIKNWNRIHFWINSLKCNTVYFYCISKWKSTKIY